MNKNMCKKYCLMLKDIILIIIGAYFISLSINMFLLPHKMTTGGASGIATILYYMFNMSVGFTVLLINIPLLIISVFKLGFGYSFKTILSIISLSIFLEIFTYSTVQEMSNIDLFISCVFGGIASGIGLSLTLRAGASSGGSDLLAQLIYKSTSIQSLSNILLGIEVVIITSIIIVFKDINVGLYSVIALYISTKIIDIVFEGMFYTKVVNIITRTPDVIVDNILSDLKRGATLVRAFGAHTSEEVTLITCIITRPQVAKLKRIVIENDKDALVYITTSNEVIGRGFKEL